MNITESDVFRLFIRDRHAVVRRATIRRTHGATSVTVGNATGHVVAQLLSHSDKNSDWIPCADARTKADTIEAGGTAMRAVWALYAFLPLLLVPGATGVFFACRSSRARMTLALILACIAAVSMCLGLMRWPSVHWALATAYANEAAATKDGIAALFDGLNLYLGTYIGEFLGETALALFFFIAGRSLLDETRYPKWLGWSGMAFALLFLVGALRNVVTSVQIVADANNILLPLWMIVLGASLIWYGHPARFSS